MIIMPSAHSHGNCELCDELERRWALPRGHNQSVLLRNVEFMRNYDDEDAEDIDLSIPRGNKWCEECRCLTNHTGPHPVNEP